MSNKLPPIVAILGRIICAHCSRPTVPPNLSPPILWCRDSRHRARCRSHSLDCCY
ncbi:MAG: hypothetical protein GPOALKHO_000195 [Sodalis sp.]|nr:MAG: hypothetical protein GPOALKHO_000195 [Sodalis sp.]